MPSPAPAGNSSGASRVPGHEDSQPSFIIPQSEGAALIDGKSYGQALQARVKGAVAAMKQAGQGVPGLAVILVGNDPASEVYVRHKEAATIAAGMTSWKHVLEADTPEEDLYALIERLNADPVVNGILLQLPLPPHMDPLRLLGAIAPEKDVDGLGALNAGRLAVAQRENQNPEGIVPCTPLGCLYLIKAAQAHLTGHESLTGLHAVMVGASPLVGRPMAQLLMQQGCTVTLVQKTSRHVPELCRQADILVVATGVPRLVKGDWVKEGAIVIDVGINRVQRTEAEMANARAEQGEKAKPTHLVGDVDMAGARLRAGAITPVPGGVGPMTIACLLSNTLEATAWQKGLRENMQGSFGA
ncbi:bifunctional methylenetetrahydrofolate dehydrogenase/methenyltetrahydrofolate cyclohydrolase [Formicincola oecophyllae]|uniref:Bifunctional protein FolD n=2 Tax=Formicincola oecophyllae TaxID=2558361 RepID=A0A4Y6UD42_9PROT|nr:bifunctional methylenetetrahydrofolate dehydrogenase/methenyltetrahydrofolate cyclohydrolase [Formicincola oecophyllae]